MERVRAPVTIRSADDDDIAALATLSTQLGYPSDADAIRERLQRVRDLNIGQVIVAVDAASRVVGWMHVVERFTLEDDPFVEIAGLIVDENARSAGVGAALLRAAESWARAQGHARLRVRSNVIRQRAHEFYKREGYAEKKRQVVFEKSLVATDQRTAGIRKLP
jgi:GNAT superfamily N-acetyltransferase